MYKELFRHLAFAAYFSVEGYAVVTKGSVLF